MAPINYLYLYLYASLKGKTKFMSELQTIKIQLRNFAKARDWDKFHSPKNLSMALSVEVSELVECFQWLTEAQSYQLNSKQLDATKDEIADVLLYLIRLADKLDIDIIQAATDKINKNELKYPADIVRGSSKKYTEYK